MPAKPTPAPAAPVFFGGVALRGPQDTLRRRTQRSGHTQVENLAYPSKIYVGVPGRTGAMPTRAKKTVSAGPPPHLLGRRGRPPSKSAKAPAPGRTSGPGLCAKAPAETAACPPLLDERNYEEYRRKTIPRLNNHKGEDHNNKQHPLVNY